MNVPGPGQPTPPLMAVDRVKEYFGQILMGLECASRTLSFSLF